MSARLHMAEIGLLTALLLALVAGVMGIVL